MRLERDTRQERVAQLHAHGVSTRAIAPIVGVSHMSVKRDLEVPLASVTPTDCLVVVEQRGTHGATNDNVCNHRADEQGDGTAAYKLEISPVFCKSIDP